MVTSQGNVCNLTGEVSVHFGFKHQEIKNLRPSDMSDMKLINISICLSAYFLQKESQLT
jgi:hypothetical protein